MLLLAARALRPPADDGVVNARGEGSGEGYLGDAASGAERVTPVALRNEKFGHAQEGDSPCRSVLSALCIAYTNAADCPAPTGDDDNSSSHNAAIVCLFHEIRIWRVKFREI